MEKRTELYGNGDQAGIDQLEQNYFLKIKAQRLGMYRRIDENNKRRQSFVYALSTS